MTYVILLAHPALVLWVLKSFDMKKAICLLLALAAMPAIAHPGHGSENPLSPGHYVANPEHALPLTLTIAAVVVVAAWLTSRKQRTSE